MKVKMNKRVLVAGKDGQLSLYRVETITGQTESHLYVYGVVGWETDAKEVAVAIDGMDPTDPIIVHINSRGGDVFEGFSIYEKILAHEGDTTAKIEGLAGSIASLIMCACDTVECYASSRVMIHKARSGRGGTADDMREEADLLDSINETMLDAYKKRSGMTKKQVEDAMAAETWYTAKEAKAAGFVDKITENSPRSEGNEMDQKERIKKIRELFAAHPGQEDLMFACIGDTDLDMDQVKSKLFDALGSNEPPADPSADPDPSDPPADPDPDPENTGTTISAEENKTRVAEIRKAFQRHEGHDDLMFTCLADMDVTVQQAKSRLLDEMSGNTDEPEILAQTGSLLDWSRARVTGDWRDGFVAGCTEVILAKCGVPPAEDSPHAEVRNEFGSMTLMEIARYALIMSGRRPEGNKLQIIADAFTHGTDDFVQILEDSARKSMLRGYTQLKSHHNRLARTMNLTDFKVNKMVGLGMFSSLDKIEPQGEYKFGTIPEFGEQIQLATYGKRFGISREAIINDDLNAFTEVPRQMGMVVGRMYGDMVAKMLAGNGIRLSRDNKVLFHDDHNNTGNSVPSTDALVAAEVAMTTHKAEKAKRDQGDPVEVEFEPAIVYTPRALRAKIETVLRSSTYVGADLGASDANVPNVVPGGLEVIPDARLDREDPQAWYVLADPNVYDTLAIAFLDGVEEPFMEQYQEPGRDGVIYRIRADVGVSALDYKGIYRGNNS